MSTDRDINFDGAGDQGLQMSVENESSEADKISWFINRFVRLHENRITLVDIIKAARIFEVQSTGSLDG